MHISESQGISGQAGFGCQAPYCTRTALATNVTAALGSGFSSPLLLPPVSSGDGGNRPLNPSGQSVPGSERHDMACVL